VNPTLSSVVTALLWAAGAGTLTWLATAPLHRRSLAWLLACVVLTGTLASVGAIFGSVRSMFISATSEATVLSVAVIAGLVAAAAAAAAGRRLARDNKVLHEALTDLGSGRVPATGGRPLTAELEQVRRQLAETAQRLADSRNRELALEASRRELVAWVSHDLRAPLAGLRAMSEALEDGVGEPAVYVKQIQAEVDRLSAMVDDLFELSRIQAGLVTRATTAISLGDLASDCVASLEPLASRQGVRLTGSNSDRGVTVLGDSQGLNRAVTNLVTNAIRHTPTDASVEIAVRAADTAGIEISVRDECGGIPAEDVGRVFDVGFRGQAARTPQLAEGSGAGLGLAIARGIIEAHAGTIEVANVPGGCMFTVRLPSAA
jgi:signal transduction histidine kinase